MRPKDRLTLAWILLTLRTTNGEGEFTENLPDNVREQRSYPQTPIIDMLMQSVAPNYTPSSPNDIFDFLRDSYPLPNGKTLQFGILVLPPSYSYTFVSDKGLDDKASYCSLFLYSVIYRLYFGISLLGIICCPIKFHYIICFQTMAVTEPKAGYLMQFLTLSLWHLLTNRHPI